MDIPLPIFYSSLVTVALIIGVGWVAGWRGWIDEHTNKTLVNLLLLVAMPCALFGSFPGQFEIKSLNSFLFGMGGGAAVLAVAIVISRLLFPRRKFQKKYFEYQFAYIFNNASFLGLPLISTIHGGEVPISYAGFIIVFNLALFSYGIMLFQQKFDWRHIAKAFINPNVLAVIVGALFFVFSLQLPAFADNGVKYIGSMMTPLALLCIGYMLSRSNLRQIIRQKVLVLTCLAQLTLGPLVTFGVLWLIGAPRDVIFVLTLIQALPTATSLGLFAEKYYAGDNSDVSSASELVAISTVLSAVTLPVVMWLVLLLV
jgi:predicted permease